LAGVLAPKVGQRPQFGVEILLRCAKARDAATRERHKPVTKKRIPAKPKLLVALAPLTREKSAGQIAEQ